MRRRRGGRRLFLGILLVVAAGVVGGCAGSAAASTPTPPTPAATPASMTPAPATLIATSSPTEAGPPHSSIPAIDAASGLPTITVAELPIEARQLIRTFRAGGPYAHSQDGSVFENREGILPHEVQGYYREYTVETPGSSDRGPRRVVMGSNSEMYYTDDHYATFKRVVQ